MARPREVTTSPRPPTLQCTTNDVIGVTRGPEKQVTMLGYQLLYVTVQGQSMQTIYVGAVDRVGV